MADKNEKLLKEIRKNFTYSSKQWADIRDEAKKDMKYVSGDPWDDNDKKERKDAGRPCLALDELGQYTNQVINGVRQNKRAIKVTPKGFGANDKTAEMWGNIIRQIEYKSNAQAAYVTAFENSLQRSYGYFRITTEFENSESFNQVIKIKRIPNPDTVYFDWDCKELDCSDADYCFVVDYIPREQFESKYPDAEIKSFSSELITEAPEWIREDRIQIAEYWKVEKKTRTLLLLDDSGKTAYLDEFPKGKEPEYKRKRKCEERKIVQYITNGIEILEKNEWAGKYIPIVPVFGKEMYVDSGSGSKRILMSLVRLARDPYMLYCYYRTCEAEVVGMTPKTPYIGYEGQTEGREDEWERVHKNPLGILLVKPITDATGQQVLPVPTRQPYDPAIQPLEVGAEAARRAIQAAMGISPLPTSAQRQNEKSGKALDRIEAQQSQGSFHFIDNHDHALEYAGRIILDLGPHIYDTEREVAVRYADETNGTIWLNKEQPSQDNPAQTEHYKTDEGEHDVTISTGPSYQSQREQANEFVANFIQNIKNLPVQPDVMAKLLSISIKMLDLGPMGDELAELLSPDDQQQMPPQAQAAVAKLQQELQHLQGFSQELHAENQKLTQEKLGKVVENQGKLEQIAAKGKWDLMLAQVTTKAQDAKLRAEIDAEEMLELHNSAHEAGMQAQEHSHQADQAAQAQQAAEAQQQGSQAHEAGMAAQAQDAAMQQQQAAQSQEAGA